MMRRGDGSLVFFTVLSQWSVGIVVCLAGIAVSGSPVPNTGSGPANPVLLALLLVVAATTASLLHLGNPLNAPKAMRNIVTSWLSREIFAIGLFTVCLLTTLVSGRMPGGSDTYPAYQLIACSVAGLFLVWAMARVYRIPTVPSWDSGFTLLGFLSTSLCLGLVAALLFDAAGVLSLADGMRTSLAALLVAVLLLETGAGFVNHYRLARMDTGMDGPRFSSGFFSTLLRVRSAMALVACLALLFMLRLEPSAAGAALPWLSLAAALVLAQAFAGRVLFFSSYFRIGL